MTDYLIYNRGSKDDWDTYAQIAADPSWSWDNVKKYMTKAERMVPPNDGHDPVSSSTQFSWYHVCSTIFSDRPI
jgi:hypothetical protein